MLLISNVLETIIVPAVAFFNRKGWEFVMDDLHRATTIWLVIINTIAIAVYGWDKFCAKQGWRRVPEKSLLLLAAIGGSIGTMGAMALFHHKTRHLKFRYGIPLLLVLQFAVLI